jgi:hypothetical protein
VEENKVVATKMGSEIGKQVEKYQKAARLSEATRRMVETNDTVSRIAQKGREMKSQLQSNK